MTPLFFKDMLAGLEAGRMLTGVIILASYGRVSVGPLAPAVRAHGECFAQLGGRLMQGLHVVRMALGATEVKA